MSALRPGWVLCDSHATAAGRAGRKPGLIHRLHDGLCDAVAVSACITAAV